MLAVPLHVPLPVALATMRFTTQVLVAGTLAFGTGSGGPKRQPVRGYSGFVPPAEVQVRLLPVSAAVVAPIENAPEPTLHDWTVVMDVAWSGTLEGSGTETPAPPK